MKTFPVAVVQMNSGPDKGTNLAKAAHAIEEAAHAGAQLVALPEVFSWRGKPEQSRHEAESIPGQTTDAMSALARRLRIHLIAGSILESIAFPAGAGGLPFNTATLFGPDGSLVAAYRKIHLFDVDLPGRVTVKESELRRAGDEVVCVQTELGRIGLAVCYDLRFPELFRKLADAGAEVIAMPSAFTKPTGQAHWEPLLRARAIENQCFVVAPNQYGVSTHGFEDYGNSLIVDPWGQVVARGPDNEAAVVTATLDAAVLERVRRELPSLEHRRLA
ncbi:MAG TPA: carbon-nitrogen hydrolase family protein [Candidatus Limnocylindrales bacterium]|nr:carbon-nitrogen hydrolase family protein [Candidatus Limnocylindrales bacterium]